MRQHPSADSEVEDQQTPHKRRDVSAARDGNSRRRILCQVKEERGFAQVRRMPPANSGQDAASQQGSVRQRPGGGHDLRAQGASVVEASVQARGRKSERVGGGTETGDHRTGVDLEKGFRFARVARVLAESGCPTPVLPEEPVIGGVPVAGEVGPQFGGEEERVRIARAAAAIEAPAVAPVGDIGRQSVRIEQRTRERAPFAGDKVPQVHSEKRGGALEARHAADNVDGVALAGIVLEQSHGRSVQ